jgi:hypothetical protein
VHILPRPKLSAQLTSKALNIVDLAPTLGHPADKSDSLAASDGGRSTSTKSPKATQGSSGRKSDSDSKLNAMRYDVGKNAARASPRRINTATEVVNGWSLGYTVDSPDEVQLGRCNLATF